MPVVDAEEEEEEVREVNEEGGGGVRSTGSGDHWWLG